MGSATDVCNVKMHVESLYAGLGITCATVGNWKDWAAQGLSCDECTDAIATTDPDTNTDDGMISGSTAYLEAEMCKASNNEASAATGMHCRSTFVTAALAALGSWVVASGIPWWSRSSWWWLPRHVLSTTPKFVRYGSC